MATTVRFPNRNPAEFIRQLKQEVAAHFERNGRRTKGGWRMVLKTVVLFALFYGPYGLSFAAGLSPLDRLGLCVLMGVGMAGLGFAVAHDALHGAYSEKAWVNRLAGYTFDLLGANGYMWRMTHNVVHHTYTNIHGVDGDLEVSPYLRLSPPSAYRRIHRYQRWYAFAAYSLSTLIWVTVKDFGYFLRRDGGPYHSERHPRREVATLLVSKAGYYAWSLAVPMLVLPVAWWQVVLGWLAMHLTAGLILGVVFQLAHVVEETAHPLPDASGNMEHAWMVHELETTANFARGNRLLTWYVGGLNHQIEHHLFPRVCSIHYPAISRIVRDVAIANGMPYHEHPTLLSAIRSHLRVLRRLGEGAMPDGEAAPTPA